MKLTLDQLLAMGFKETDTPGIWRKPSQFWNSPQTHAKAPQSDSVVVGATKPPKRIRQSTKPLLNKLEGEALDFLNRVEPNDYIPQGIRFKLANGLWYKPDIVCFDIKTCWEIKGPFAHRGGFENLKMAASKYPRFTWKLWWKEGDQWKEQVVLP